MKKAPKKVAAKAPKKPSTKKSADLVARLIASPDDATRGVYADWLMEQGDPLGEYMTLELAGKTAAAKKLFKQHAAAFVGDLAPRMFDWEKGLIDGIRLPQGGKPAMLIDVLDRAFALPTAILVRKVRVASRPDDALVARLNQMPPTVVTLFAYATDALAALARPQLEHLELWIPDAKLDANALCPVFAATKLPGLRALSIYGGGMPTPVLTALLDSELLRRLESLDIAYGTLDVNQKKLVQKSTAKLGHLKALSIDDIDGLMPALRTAWEARDRTATFGNPLAGR
ncbi:MAG: TIGR02996 domain-containing protein [Kofleriaceae bacterium]